MRPNTRSMCIALILMIGCAAAVPAGAVELVMGGKVGWNNSDLLGSNDSGISTRNGPIFGAIVGWQIHPWFSVHLEPNFTHKGADLENLTFGDLPATFKLSYVELPVLAKFKYVMPSGSNGGLFGTFGPSFGIATHAEARYAGEDTNVNQQVEDFDLGLCVGAGYDIPAGPGLATLEVRYVFGLLEVFESSAPGQEVTGDLKNSSLQVTVGWFRRVF